MSGLTIYVNLSYQCRFAKQEGSIFGEREKDSDYGTMALLLDQNKATSDDEALKTFLHYDEDPHHLHRNKTAAHRTEKL